ncbi:MAG: NAD(P)-dependent oxidoreductase [Candidatus Hydrogenedentes bacterium]|nr:NAD(P)-dependent oxidoreductase [Candidatus Hydrogenedentota bacterium]
MSSILVTGASGFIGRALSKSLSGAHDVVCMSRRDPDLGLDYVKGEFSSFEDLRRLDAYAIDAVIHLGAVTGGCSERDAILVNVEGTRCLMRYLMDRGCAKFVMASSIAAIGIQNVRCRPQELPVPDEHPCLDCDGYGVSKYLMEEVTRYYARQNENIDVINLRLSTVVPEDKPASLRAAGPLGPWALGSVTVMLLPDAMRAFTLAVEAPRSPGVRIMNAAGPKAWAKDPVGRILRGWYGNDVDVSHFERPGHEFDSVYDVSRIEHELGFVAERTPDVVFPGEQAG